MGRRVLWWEWQIRRRGRRFEEGGECLKLPIWGWERGWLQKHRGYARQLWVPSECGGHKLESIWAIVWFSPSELRNPDVEAEKAGSEICLRLGCARQCDECQKAPGRSGRIEEQWDEELPIFKRRYKDWRTGRRTLHLQVKGPHRKFDLQRQVLAKTF